LQLIAPTVSTLWVSNSVRAPARADANAASVPAWPPPMTMTSWWWKEAFMAISFALQGRGS
jgi:hypothetical protein